MYDDETAHYKFRIMFILNGVFIEIMNNYFIQTDKSKLPFSKQSRIQALEENIYKLFKEKEFFKCLKRAFLLETIHGKVDSDLLDFLNSDFGMLYKTIHDLELVLKMSQQKFKALGHTMLIENLESIKAFTSHITKFEVDTILDSINLIVEDFAEQKLEQLITYCEKNLNELTKPQMKTFL